MTFWGLVMVLIDVGGGEAPRGTTSYKQFTFFSSEDISLEPQGSELVQWAMRTHGHRGALVTCML